MVIYNLYIAWTGIRPGKAYPVSLVDAYAELADAISRESLQTITRRDPQVLKGQSRVYLLELSGRYAPQAARTPLARRL